VLKEKLGAVPVVPGVNAYIWRDVSFMTDLLVAADLVICQGGHNTVAELQAAGVPGVIVPAARNIDDQWERAREAAAGSELLAAVADPETDLGPLIAAAMTREAIRPPPVDPPLDFAELRRVVELGRVDGIGDESGLPRMSDVNHHR
jgi:predicted glycosyltransferase